MESSPINYVNKMIYNKSFFWKEKGRDIDLTSLK